MPIETFWTFAALLLAGRKIAIATGAGEYAEAFAELLENGNGLKATLRESGLAPLAREMERKAEQALSFTHPGPARDDAQAIFWQVAPVALSKRDALAAANLDPRAACDRMVAAIKTSPLGPDFSATPLAERYFREITVPLLNTMISDSAYMTDLTPILWRESLNRQGLTLDRLTTLDAKQDGQTAMLEELLARTAPSLPLATAKAILADFGHGEIPDDPDQIARLLRIAAEQYQAMQARLLEYDNSADLIVRDLSHAAQALVEQGRFDEADAKLGEIERHSDLVKAKARSDRGELARLRLRYRDAADHFAVAASMVPEGEPEARWRYELRRADALSKLGAEFGENSALGEAIALYRENVLPLAPLLDRPGDWATTKNDLGFALATLGEREQNAEYLAEALEIFRDCLRVFTRNDFPLLWTNFQNNLGNTLRIFGIGQSQTAHLYEAVAAHREALKECTLESAPELWAANQANLGNALQTIGERETGTARLVEAAAAHREALKGHPRESAPLRWAATQGNLGNSLLYLGQRETETESLADAVTAFRSALGEFSRDRAPLDWAGVQNNLGNALAVLGMRENSTDLLEQAVTAYRAALEKRTRDRVPLDWAVTQANLGNALQTLGIYEAGTKSLFEAVAAYRNALGEQTRERLPLAWATTNNNLAIALAEIASRTNGNISEALAAIDGALEVFRDSGSASYIERAEAIRRHITGESPA